MGGYTLLSSNLSAIKKKSHKDSDGIQPFECVQCVYDLSMFLYASIIPSFLSRVVFYCRDEHFVYSLTEGKMSHGFHEHV